MAVAGQPERESYDVETVPILDREPPLNIEMPGMGLRYSTRPGRNRIWFSYPSGFRLRLRCVQEDGAGDEMS